MMISTAPPHALLWPRQRVPVDPDAGSWVGARDWDPPTPPGSQTRIMPALCADGESVIRSQAGAGSVKPGAPPRLAVWGIVRKSLRERSGVGVDMDILKNDGGGGFIGRTPCRHGQGLSGAPERIAWTTSMMAELAYLESCWSSMRDE